MVFFEHRQVIRYPLPAIVADGRVPDGIAIGIHDFGIIHNAGYAVRVGDVLGSIQVVHGTVQHSIAVCLPAGKCRAVGCLAAHIAHCIQIYLGNADLTQGAVVFHLAVCGSHRIAVLIGGFAAVVGVVNAGRFFILNLRSRSLAGFVNNNGGFYAAAGHQLGAALVGCQNIGAVVGIVQPKHRIIVGFGDFDVIGALAQGCACCAGVVDVRPVAKISGRGFGFHKDKLALIALGVIQRVAHGIRGGIGGAVDDRISSISLTLHAVGVVAAGWLVFAGHHIPLIDLILGIGCNLAAGFAVGLLEVDLQTPLIIFHNIVVVGVCGYRDGLAAAVRAPIHCKAIRHIRFLIAEGNACQLCLGGSNRIVHHALRFGLQIRNSSISGAVRSRIRSILRSIRANPAAFAVGGFCNGIVQAPTCACIAAVLLVVVIGGMTAGGHSLLVCRADAPAAAVDVPRLGNGFDLNGRTIHFFLCFQLDLIGRNTVVPSKAAAFGLRRGAPAGVIFLLDRLGVRLLIADLRANQGNGLPSLTAGIVDIGVITAGGGVGFHAVQQLVGRGKINFRGGTFREALNDIHLHIVINRRAEIQKRGFFTFIRGKNNRATVQHTKGKLVEAAPDTNLVAIMVARDALIGAYRRSMRIAVWRAARRLTVGTVGAAVGGFAAEPDQPSAVDLGNLGNFAACHSRGGALGKGGNLTVREGVLSGRTTVNGHL